MILWSITNFYKNNWKIMIFLQFCCSTFLLNLFEIQIFLIHSPPPSNIYAPYVIFDKHAVLANSSKLALKWSNATIVWSAKNYLSPLNYATSINEYRYEKWVSTNYLEFEFLQLLIASVSVEWLFSSAFFCKSSENVHSWMNTSECYAMDSNSLHGLVSPL